MFDFIILTAPRSGSHMLATALDCHPDLHSVGEYGEKNVPVPGKRNFAIVHAKLHYAKAALAGHIPDKIIFLVRQPEGRIQSRINAGNAVEVDVRTHYFEPAAYEARDSGITTDDEGYKGVRAVSEKLFDLIGQHDGLILEYEDITGDLDCRKIPEHVADQINQYLQLSPCDYVPRTYKPSVIYEEKTSCVGQ